MVGSKKRVQGSLLVAAALALGLGALPGCFVRTGGDTSGHTTGYTTTAQPTLRILSFRDRSGIIRIHNTTGNTLRQVTVGVRGFECQGAEPTRTMIRSFSVYLQPGYWRNYSFTFGAYCRRMRAVVVAR